MTEDQTQRVNEDATQRMDDELTERIPDQNQDDADALAVTQWVAARSLPVPAKSEAPAVPGDQTQPMPDDLTQPFTDEQTQQPEPARQAQQAHQTHQAPQSEQTQPFDGADETQAVSRDRTQRMDDELTERVAGNPDDVETYVHFGPGVPVAASPPPDRATAIWRGTTEGGEGASGTAAAATTVRTPRSGGQRWILPLTVLILVVAVVLYFLFGRSSPTMSVSGVTVHTSSAKVTCSGQETLTGVITTDGGAGTLDYQWVRSDGTKSDLLHQVVNSGDKVVDVTLVWNFEGTGSLHATAVLDILGPGTARSASASFDYSCSG